MMVRARCSSSSHWHVVLKPRDDRHAAARHAVSREKRRHTDESTRMSRGPPPVSDSSASCTVNSSRLTLRVSSALSANPRSDHRRLVVGELSVR
jgi:hypothetical protein